MTGVKLYKGDCLEVMRKFPDNLVDSIITDPPYGLKFMGKEWDHGVPGKPFWGEMLRVAKPGATLLVFGGTRTHHRLMCAIEDAGWEIRDCLMWLYGTGFPKSHDISKAIDKKAGAEREVVRVRTSAFGTNTATGERVSRSDNKGGAGLWGGSESKEVALRGAPTTSEAELWDGWGTALKPAWEPIILAMKPLDGTFVNNALTHGVAGLNIDASRIRSGRWPANLILDEDAAELLDEQSGVLTSGTGAVKRESGEGYSPNAYGKESRPAGTPNIEYGDSGGASRFFYCSKASRSERGEGNNHPTVKPLDLMRYLCTLTKPPKESSVLDPFMGSGTTGIACINTGRKFIGIEKDNEYYLKAKQRIQEHLSSTRKKKHHDRA